MPWRAPRAYDAMPAISQRPAVTTSGADSRVSRSRPRTAIGSATNTAPRTRRRQDHPHHGDHVADAPGRVQADPERGGGPDRHHRRSQRMSVLVLPLLGRTGGQHDAERDDHEQQRRGNAERLPATIAITAAIAPSVEATGETMPTFPIRSASYTRARPITFMAPDRSSQPPTSASSAARDALRERQRQHDHEAGQHHPREHRARAELSARAAGAQRGRAPHQRRAEASEDRDHGGSIQPR